MSRWTSDGLDVGWFEERLAGGYRPKFLYIIPEFQNPSGRTLTLERRQALVDVCRRYGVLIFEDVAYRELSFDGSSLPSLWSLGPDVVLQAGTFSKVLCPGVRLGWACGPARDRRQARDGQEQHRPVQRAPSGSGSWRSTAARGCSAQRLPAARALYASHWAALSAALEEHMPDGCEWSQPTGGMFTWLRLPEGWTPASCGRRRPRRASRTCPGGRSTSATRARASSGCRSAR